MVSPSCAPSEPSSPCSPCSPCAPPTAPWPGTRQVVARPVARWPPSPLVCSVTPPSDAEPGGPGAPPEPELAGEPVSRLVLMWSGPGAPPPGPALVWSAPGSPPPAWARSTGRDAAPVAPVRRPCRRRSHRRRPRLRPRPGRPGGLSGRCGVGRWRRRQVRHAPTGESSRGRRVWPLPTAEPACRRERRLPKRSGRKGCSWQHPLCDGARLRGASARPGLAAQDQPFAGPHQDTGGLTDIAG